MAIGSYAWATGDHSLALGYGASAGEKSSVAIGPNASTYTENQVVLGSYNSEVYVPGNLRVGGVVSLDNLHVSKLTVGPTTDYDSPTTTDYVAHFRGNVFIGKRNLLEKEIQCHYIFHLKEILLL